MRPPILIDVDGVLCDLDAAVIPLISRVAGKKFTAEDYTDWDYKIAFGLTEAQDREVHEYMRQRGFYEALPVVPGAFDALDALRGLGDVVAVTSLMSGLHYAGERLEWLHWVLKFDYEDVVLTKRKNLVTGVTLIDDYAVNVAAWEKQWDAAGILWDRPCNRTVKATQRAHGWKELISMTLRQCAQWDEGEA